MPRVFALLPDKTQETYKKLFQIIKTLLGIEFQPESISTDFEKGNINCIHELYPDADIFCCLFHFCQAHYRKLVDLGFKHQYGTEPEFSIQVRCLTALAFLPIEDVVDAFEELIDMEDSLLPPDLVANYNNTKKMQFLRQVAYCIKLQV